MCNELINTTELINIINNKLTKEEKYSGLSYYDTYLKILQDIKKEDINKIILLPIKEEVKKKLFKNSIEAYNDIVNAEIDRVMKYYMSNSSVSYGEAYIFADKHFQQEINHLKIFTTGLTFILQGMNSLIEQGKIKKDILVKL
jgi:hypothetical protein